MEYITCYDSPLGPLTLSADEEGLTGISFSAPSVVTDDNAVLAQTKHWLDTYFRGEAPDPASIPLHLKGTPFQLLVWNRLLSIPYGESITYGELAREAARQLGRKSMSAQAIAQRSAVMKKTQSDNELFTFRVWLVRLGLNGEEFKHTRDHLLANLDGDRAWRFDKDSYTVNQKKKKSREMER